MLTLIAAILTVASVYLSGRKNIWAWPLGLGGAVLWVWFALSIGDVGVLLMNSFFCALYVYNFITWKGYNVFGFLKRFRKTPRNENFCASPGILREVEPSPYLEKQALEDCKTCGCLLSSERSRPVEVAVYDFAFYIAREGRNLPPYENLVCAVRYDFYCKRDRPPYDRMVFTPHGEGETTVEFFVANRDARPGDRLYRQVTEEGEQYG